MVVSCLFVSCSTLLCSRGPIFHHITSHLIISHYVVIKQLRVSMRTSDLVHWAVRIERCQYTKHSDRSMHLSIHGLIERVAGRSALAAHLCRPNRIQWPVEFVHLELNCHTNSAASWFEGGFCVGCLCWDCLAGFRNKPGSCFRARARSLSLMLVG